MHVSFFCVYHYSEVLDVGIFWKLSFRKLKKAGQSKNNKKFHHMLFDLHGRTATRHCFSILFFFFFCGYKFIRKKARKLEALLVSLCIFLAVPKETYDAFITRRHNPWCQLLLLTVIIQKKTTKTDRWETVVEKMHFVKMYAHASCVASTSPLPILQCAYAFLFLSKKKKNQIKTWRWNIFKSIWIWVINGTFGNIFKSNGIHVFF